MAIIFPFTINWGEGFKLSLSHNTVVTQGVDLPREQRRPLQSRMFKRVELQIVPDNIAMQDKVLSWITQAQNQVVVLPMFSEIYTVSDDLDAGGTGFVLQEYLGDSFFINEFYDVGSTYVILIDYATGLMEYNKKTDIYAGDGSVGVANSLLNNYLAKSTIIYPALVCTLDAVEYTLVTDRVTPISLQFSEYIVGQI